MNHDLVLCGSLLAAIGLISGLSFLAARVHWLLKIGFAIALVLTAIYTWFVAMDLFGYPVPSLPPNGETVLAVMVDEQKDIIALWVEGSDRPPRNYAVPYDAKLAQKLLDASARALATHSKMILRVQAGKNWIFSTSDPGDLDIDVVSAIPPK